LGEPQACRDLRSKYIAAAGRCTKTGQSRSKTAKPGPREAPDVTNQKAVASFLFPEVSMFSSQHQGKRVGRDQAGPEAPRVRDGLCGAKPPRTQLGESRSEDHRGRSATVCRREQWIAEANSLAIIDQKTARRRPPRPITATAAEEATLSAALRG